jgi:hypothetical protein
MSPLWCCIWEGPRRIKGPWRGFGRCWAWQGTVDLELMASLRDLISFGEPSIEAEKEAVHKAVARALDSLEAMRIAEGKAIESDMSETVGLGGTGAERPEGLG